MIEQINRDTHRPYDGYSMNCRHCTAKLIMFTKLIKMFKCHCRKVDENVDNLPLDIVNI